MPSSLRRRRRRATVVEPPTAAKPAAKRTDPTTMAATAPANAPALIPSLPPPTASIEEEEDFSPFRGMPELLLFLSVSVEDSPGPDLFVTVAAAVVVVGGAVICRGMEKLMDIVMD